jgi:4-hydroxyphenylpyruvate dioxygenase
MANTFSIKKVDHLEFYVGNAKQAALFYAKCFGFSVTAYSGLETGDRKITSYVLEQGDIRFVLSSAMGADHPIAQSVLTHGDTIATLALEVSDVDCVYQHAIQNGAIGAILPTDREDAEGVFRYAAIHAYGDTFIKFIQRDRYAGTFAPGFVPRSVKVDAKNTTHSTSGYLSHIDHIVGNVEQGKMDEWVNFFVKTMGFDLKLSFDDQAISTEYSALMSKVLQNGSKTSININEPATGRRKSQIQEYLDFHNGPGIQHIGLATSNIVETVQHLKQSGVEFLPIPKTYYQDLETWVHEIDIPVVHLAELGILIDRDEDGYLLQLFTKPLGDRPTLFFEIIERHGCKGFGTGNFKSLFVALEREQAKRGNL